MDSKLKKRWIKALRSGEYKQGEGQLCSIDEGGIRRYCCLGVLKSLILNRDLKRAEGNDSYISDKVIPLETQKRYADHNDRGKTFKQIARYLEQEKSL